MKVLVRLTSVLMTVVVLMTALASPVTANQGRRQGQVLVGDARRVEVEIRQIDGRPMLVVETRKGVFGVPVILAGSAFVDGVEVPFSFHGDNVLVQTDGHPIYIPIKDFDVIMRDGQLMLKAEVNPVFTIGLAFVVAKYGAKALGGKAAAGSIGAKAGALLDAAILTYLVSQALRSPAPAQP